MLKFLPLYIKIPVVSCSLIYVLSTAFSQTPDFTTKLNDYIDANTIKQKKTELTAIKDNSTLDYQSGDWSSIIIDPRYQHFLDPDKQALNENQFNIKSYGSMKLNLLYGKSFFTKKS